YCLDYARFHHYFIDDGLRRFVKYFLIFPLHRTHLIKAIQKQCRSIQNRADKPRDTPPSLSCMSCSGVSAKVKAQAEAGEMDRTRAARITLSRGTKALHTTIA